MTNWPIEEIESCLERHSFGAYRKLQTKDYCASGKFPIVDQGQSEIAGWTDSDEGLIQSPLPVVVFGDHTRAFKFVDFPFVRGADGTQVLRPRNDIVPLFFYYACLAIDLPGRGYNRHFTILKKKSIPLPPSDVQAGIAAALRAVEDGAKLQSNLFASLDRLKRAAMRELFTRGLRGEARKETEFGQVPEGWIEAELDKCSFVQTGAAKGRKLGDSETMDVPYLRVANVQDGHLDLSEVKSITIRKTELERYRLQDGDVVLTEGGDFDKLGRGFIWRAQLPLCVHQNHVFAVRTKSDRLLPDFLAYLAQSAYGKAYFLKVAHKTTNLACINSEKLKAFPTVLPAIEEQREIVAILDALDRKINFHRRKKAVLEDLFKTLLHKLMTGEIGVADLDLSALRPLEAAA